MEDIKLPTSHALRRFVLCDIRSSLSALLPCGSLLVSGSQLPCGVICLAMLLYHATVFYSVIVYSVLSHDSQLPYDVLGVEHTVRSRSAPRREIVELELTRLCLFVYPAADLGTDSPPPTVPLRQKKKRLPRSSCRFFAVRIGNCLT